MKPHRALLVHPGIHEAPAARAYPPWGLLCVASALRLRGVEVLVLDLNGEDVRAALEVAWREFSPTVMGITGKMGVAATRMGRAVAVARELDPRVPVGVGGPLAASFPELRHPFWAGVTALFLGDGEDSFASWLGGGCEAGVYGPSEVADIDAVGVPWWWDGLREYVLPPEDWPNMGVPGLHVSAGRGCTRRCTFCYLNTQYPGTRFRGVSAPRLLADLDRLHERFGASGFYFVDDCFVDVGRVRLDALCAALARRGAPYRFGCDLQLDELSDPALLERMQRAGFRCFYVGLEAASEGVRRRLGKAPVSGELRDVVARAQSMGLLVHASIGIGWPGESERDIHATLTLIDALPDLLFDAFRYQPLPDVPLTRLWRRTAGRGLPGAAIHAQQDFSDRAPDCSDVAPRRFEALWQALLERQESRYARYFPHLYGEDAPPSPPSARFTAVQAP